MKHYEGLDTGALWRSGQALLQYSKKSSEGSLGCSHTRAVE